jgi:hypothetical protein
MGPGGSDIAWPTSVPGKGFNKLDFCFIPFTKYRMGFKRGKIARKVRKI